jgi:hypothetical protein
MVFSMKTHKTTAVEKHNFYDVFRSIIDHLPSRSQEIVAKRFGVYDEKPMTLQAIGDEYGITRERVRQIVQSGIRGISDYDDHEAFLAVRGAIVDFVEKHYGIVLDKMIMDTLGKDHATRGSIRFFIESLPDITYINPKQYPVLDGVVTHYDFNIDQWHTVHVDVRDTFLQTNATHPSTILHTQIAQKHDVAHDQLMHYLDVSREIGKNPFDKWGLVDWDEISPRGVREKALLILKEKNTPMHFREIAQAIDDYGLGKKGRKSHPQTVHNELIRDDNFVLVGRGVYALKNDDYVKGTVKDVITRVLENAEKPLSADEVIERVLRMRHVKPSTIKVNLNAVAKKISANKKYTLETRRI